MEQISAFSLFLGSPSGHSFFLILPTSYVGILSFPSFSFSPVSELCLSPDVFEKLQYFWVLRGGIKEGLVEERKECKLSQAHPRLCWQSSPCLIGPRWWATCRGSWQILMVHTLPLTCLLILEKMQLLPPRTLSPQKTLGCPRLLLDQAGARDLQRDSFGCLHTRVWTLPQRVPHRKGREQTH